tara:strand:- start:53129 stop:53764 length:636 start_codon:yes stop_codon:yes gene_type:complete
MLRLIFRSIPLILMRIVAGLIFVIILHSTALSQINFGSFGSYTIQLTEISTGSLTFEGLIIPESGTHEIQLADAFIIEIEGVKYLDVGVLITADVELLLDGNINNVGNPQKSITFTLEAAYANKGQQNTADADLITILSNVGDARFPILARQFQPPGPPPPPPTEAFDQSAVNEAAYLYLYGNISVGNVDAGTYTGNINISVQYDNPPENP